MKPAWDRYWKTLQEEGQKGLDEKFGPGPEIGWNDDKSIQLWIECDVVELATGESTGMCRFSRGRKILDVYTNLRGALTKEGLEDEYFTIDFDHRGDKDARWPGPGEYRWIACYAVQGSCEGWYYHVDLVGGNIGRRCIFLGKTFLGWDHAWKAAKRCAELLGA